MRCRNAVSECSSSGSKAMPQLWVEASCELRADAVVLNTSPARKKYASYPVSQSKQWGASRLWSSTHLVSQEKQGL